MKRRWILGMFMVVMLAVTLAVVSGKGAFAGVREVAETKSVQALSATTVVTSPADSGPGTLRRALLNAVNGDTITFDPVVFPPGSPVTITLASALPNLTQGNLTIDASIAGVILDGSGIGTTPEAVLLDDVSLTVDGGPNLLANGDFGAGLEHWRPWDERPGATRGVDNSDFTSSPNSYEWTSVAHVGYSSTFYDTSDTSAPFSDSPFHDGSTVWVPTTGGSTVALRFWYRYGGLDARLWVLTSRGGREMGHWWFDRMADWTEAAITQALPGGAVGVAFHFEFQHTARESGGLSVTSSGNIIQGVQIVNFPGSGVELSDGAQDNVVGGDRGVGTGPMGQGNLISGNGDYGVFIYGAETMRNSVIGDYIGIGVDGETGVPNRAGIFIWDGADYNTIGGTTPGERNVISGNAVPGGSGGIWISAADHNVISGNYVGTDATGTAPLGNGTGLQAGSGVSISDGAKYNVVGGNTAEERNVISGNNGAGIQILFDVQYTIVSGNYIGTDWSGTAALPNIGYGVQIGGASNSVIGGGNASPGGACSGECNLISGNGLVGVAIAGSGTAQNLVSGNYIGTDVNGETAVPNGDNGVYVFGGASLNVIGGETSAERNLVSGNNGSGVVITGGDTMSNTVSGNYIGTDATGALGLGNGGGVGVESGARHNMIGGNNTSSGTTCMGECNLISGNRGDGVGITGGDTMNNTISGNYVGTDATGSLSLGNGGDGVRISDGAQYNVIGGDTLEKRNVVGGNGESGISVRGGATENVIIGNYIGTDVSGTAALANGDGIHISDGASYNSIGGGIEGERNIISGNNHDGVRIDGGGSSGNTVQGNFIGTDATGTRRLPNGPLGKGVFIFGGATDNVIGGSSPNQGNLISGNDYAGIEINGIGTTGNVVWGDYIGTDVTGTTALGNWEKGVFIFNGAQYNRIGGTAAGERNVISGNDGNGVQLEGLDSDHNVVIGNYIGIDVSGTAALPNKQHGVSIVDGASRNMIGISNTIAFNTGNGVEVDGRDTISNTMTRNSIYENARMGISLSDGGNAELPTPTIMAYDLGAGTVSGSACGNCTIEIFSDGDDEGALYEGQTTTDGTGSFVFSKGAPLTGPNLTATATDAAGNTSEFSVVERTVYLPLVLKHHEPSPGFPVFIGDTIASRPVSQQGEIFYITSVRIPARLTPGARYYLSSQKDAVAETLVDDKLAVLLDSVEIFAFDFSAASGRPEFAFVELPWTVMEQMVDQTVTVEYRDVRAHVVSASPIWLIEALPTNGSLRQQAR